MNLCGVLCAQMEYFREKKLLQIYCLKRTYLGWDSFTELFLSSIIKYGKNDIEWQTSIQGMSWVFFYDYFRKREESLILFSDPILY